MADKQQKIDQLAETYHNAHTITRDLSDRPGNNKKNTYIRSRKLLNINLILNFIEIN